MGERGEAAVNRSGTQGEAKVRPARSPDLPSVGRLGALLVEEHHGFDSRRFLAAGEHTAAGYAAFLGTQLDSPDVALLVAESGDGIVIGYAYAAVEGHDWMALR